MSSGTLAYFHPDPVQLMESTSDQGISRTLGLPDLATLRALLASDPVVSNRRL